MKTTVELSDALMWEMKEQARASHSSMREIMEAAMRLYLDQLKQPRENSGFRTTPSRAMESAKGLKRGPGNRSVGIFLRAAGDDRG